MKGWYPVSTSGGIRPWSLTSVPNAAKARPKSTVTALPLELPLGSWFSTYAAYVWPPLAFQPFVELIERVFAHSDRLDFPIMIPPFLLRFATTVASFRTLAPISA